MKFSGHRKLLCELSKFSKFNAFDLLLFTNSAQRELVSICTQSINDRNKLSLPYILVMQFRKAVLHFVELYCSFVELYYSLVEAYCSLTELYRSSVELYCSS